MSRLNTRPVLHRLFVALLGGILFAPPLAMAMDESPSGHQTSMNNHMNSSSDSKGSSVTKNKDHDSTRGMTNSGGLPLKMKKGEDYRQRNEMMEQDRHAEQFKRP